MDHIDLSHARPQNTSKDRDSDWGDWLMRSWYSKSSFIAVLLALPLQGAMAQKGCDQFNAGEGAGTNPAVVRVTGVPGRSVYLCGYVLMHKQGAAVDFELTSGIGNNCATDTNIMLPRMTINPGMSLVNRIPYAYGEFTKPGHSLCTQTFGNGTVYTIFYWAQY